MSKLKRLTLRKYKIGLKKKSKSICRIFIISEKKTLFRRFFSILITEVM